jgi:hypothetical protein
MENKSKSNSKQWNALNAIASTIATYETLKSFLVFYRGKPVAEIMKT